MTDQNPNAGFALAICAQTADQAMPIAQMLAKSELVPKAFQGHPSDIIIAGAMGQRLGLDVFTAMQSLAVVNGKPELYGDAMLGICQSRPDWRGMQVDWSGEGDTLTCTVVVKRALADGTTTPTVGTFSVADAKKAGLWTKQGPWSNYPRRMLELRARAFALRGAFADALAGFHAREEIEDEPREAQGVVVHDDAPRRRTRVVRPSLEIAGEPGTPNAPAQDAPTATIPAEAVPADPPKADPAQESAPTAPAPAFPSLLELRSAVKSAADSVAGGLTKVLADLSNAAGYPIAKAQDVAESDRAKVILLCREMAGQPS
jgi:hypothetical protein